jgi:hypothetical protein
MNSDRITGWAGFTGEVLVERKNSLLSSSLYLFTSPLLFSLPKTLSCRSCKSCYPVYIAHQGKAVTRSEMRWG